MGVRRFTSAKCEDANIVIIKASPGASHYNP
jgi:hypothetical protein